MKSASASFKGWVNSSIHGVFYCPHQTSDNCECHKPKPGLLLKAVAGRGIDAKSCYYVGDSEEDMLAAQTFGCFKILVLSGRLKKEDVPALKAAPDLVKSNLLEAAEWLSQRP